MIELKSQPSHSTISTRCHFHPPPSCRFVESLSLHPSNGGRTYPLVHGNGHCDWVQADGTAHEPPHARRTIPATVARMHRLIVENRKGFHPKSICLFLFPIEQKSVVVGFVTIDGILG